MQLVEAWRERRRLRKERLAATKRLGQDESAWTELFRHPDWAPMPVGHMGRCGQCGARIDLDHHRCPHCGAEWRHNTRRGDLYRQIAVLSGATVVSVLSGYGCALWLRAHFAAMVARGQAVNPEMVETLAAFLWMLSGVLMMIILTYAIERFNLAPIGHWRLQRAHPPAESGKRRKTDG